MNERRFVILRHDHPFLHWDFLVEEPELATTWRLMREPCLAEPILAEPIEDHRLTYLDYEGPVSRNRGNVERVLAGVVAQELPSNDVSCRVFELENQAFCRRAMFKRSEDGRWFVRFESRSCLVKS
jgi:hypothetical protein